MDGWTDRQIDKQIDRLDRQTDRQADRQIDRWVDRQIEFIFMNRIINFGSTCKKKRKKSKSSMTFKMGILPLVGNYIIVLSRLHTKNKEKINDHTLVIRLLCNLYFCITLFPNALALLNKR